jgi:ribosome biogenesis GTPase / thiamine phosphate phosphatase
VSYLHELGWSSYFQQHLKIGESRTPARVVEEQRSAYRVACEAGELLAETAGHLRHIAVDRSGLPAVGDWVLVEARFDERRATIHEVLPRKTRFSRKVAGSETAEQVIAANIDTVFLMTSLNAELNTRRIERYLTMIWESGAQPVIVFTKADLCDDAVRTMQEVTEVAFGVRMHALSSVTGEGLDQLGEYLQSGRTVALLGSSGVGKSTLINRLLGHEIQKVREIREGDDRGRHATTARRLFQLPGGGMVIDTPGMRELQLWDAPGGLSQTFSDIETFAERCRFRDCRHIEEPGCSVQAALRAHQLSPERFESYLKLQRELDYLERKQDVAARAEHNRQWKRLHKAARNLYKNRDKP